MPLTPLLNEVEVPQDFRSEYESESLSHFRSRYMILAGVVAAMLFAIGVLQLHFSAELASLSRPGRLGGLAAAFAGCGGVLVRLLQVAWAKRPFTREQLLNRVRRLIIAFTLLQIPAAFALSALINRAIEENGGTFHLGFGIPPLLASLLVHFVAALLIPWTVREAIRPILPFVLVFTFISVLALVTGDSDLAAFLLHMLVTVTVVVPGLVISWWRNSRFTEGFMNRAVRARYAELSAELSTARRIHDRLFPLPIRDGSVRVEFAYEPMRQIGGDILYARRSDRGVIDLVVIDVTGHGIAAALAVNRLHAELSRVYGVNPAAAPEQVIAALNSYVGLTMASDRIFATALCVRVDPVCGTVTYSNAGHPPGMLFSRRSGAGWRTLDATATMLGVLDEPDFTSGTQCLPLHAGDVLYCYSDGAIESRTPDDRMLGLDGFRRMLEKVPPPESVVSDVRTFRGGPPQDDTLVVRVERIDQA
ncbi:MAG TPA: PP2C family protein-serine/threonine phosphatase [Phycisphaerales bacterium]|nr:PP2C family protein-serine/threonine phosphatase [Phycisphaerales bacterium]